MKELFWLFYRKVNKLPRMARLEACSLCQLNCKDCYMRNQKNETVIGNGYLTYENFKKFLKRNPYIKEIELSFSGEIFLNPELSEIIKYAYKKNIQLTAFNGVNFNNVSDDLLEILVKYKFTGLTLSIDGATNETYIQYRRNGDLNKVLSNIDKLNKYKQKYNSKFPIIQWQYIMFSHNKHEISKAIDLAIKYNVANIYFKKPWKEQSKDYSISPNDIKKIQKIIENCKKDKTIIDIISRHMIPTCYQLWLQPQINWDGKLLGCFCSVYNDLNINVFDTGLKKALESKQMKEIRSVICGKKIIKSDIACKNCSFYEEMNRKKQFVKEKELKFV